MTPTAGFLNVFDPYERKARLFPGIMVVMPPALLFLALAFQSLSPAKVIYLLFFSAGGAYWMGRIVRDFGKSSEEKLFEKWGGKPSTRLLRHVDTTIDPVTKRRYHEFIITHAKIQLPNPHEETAFPVQADDAYRSAIVWLIGKTRDKTRFSLLFKENVSYGYSRNMYGVRHFGMVSAALSLTWALVHLGYLRGQKPFFTPIQFSTIPPLSFIAITAVGAILLSWIFIFTEALVKRSAFTYSERLLATIDELGLTTAA